jgi:hypothetical protein
LCALFWHSLLSKKALAGDHVHPPISDLVLAVKFHVAFS